MCKFFKWLTFWLVFVGALNWGLIGLLQFDLVAFLLGDMTLWTRIVYVLVGLSALIYGSIIYVCAKNETDY
ncbi:DUF378 domain-containing protein [bacterium]|nr:DUF378 domain-containing protein [bacterium]